MKTIKKYLVPILLTILLIILLHYNTIKVKYLSYTTGYQEETLKTMFNESIYYYIQDNKYSKTLDEIINTSYYNIEYLNEYLNILYIDNETFLNNLNNLLDKGYRNKEINLIFQKLNDENIQILLNEEYNNKLYNFLELSYFKETNFKRYLDYYKNNQNKTIDTIITNVNIGLDNKFYTNIKKIENPNDPLVLVNKYNKLSSSFVPQNLKKLASSSAKLTKEAATAFDKMSAAAKKDGLKIYGSSGYRSYNHQANLYNNYVKQDGVAGADTYSARAGHSEHQTGLAIDITTGKGNYIYATDKEYTWLINNSYKYGFILRYPKGKEHITGYKYEPWHYRYLGVELATEIHNLNITYEEYVAKK